MFVLTNVSTMVACGRLTWLPFFGMRSAMWEKNLRSFYWRSQSQLAKGSRDFDSFPFMQKIAVKCPVMRREGPMEQWYQKRIHMFCNNRSNSICRVFWEKCFFVDYLCLGSMFLMTCLIMVKVPPPFSTSIQDGYLEVGEIMQATLDGCWAHPSGCFPC